MDMDISKGYRTIPTLSRDTPPFLTRPCSPRDCKQAGYHGTLAINQHHYHILRLASHGKRWGSSTQLKRGRNAQREPQIFPSFPHDEMIPLSLLRASRSLSIGALDLLCAGALDMTVSLSAINRAEEVAMSELNGSSTPSSRACPR